MNLGLFEAPVVGVTLRDYQAAQAQSTRELWHKHPSVLIVSSVGSGKTTTFCYIVAERREMGRALILAHRSELVTQAIDRLKMFGIEPARDQAKDRAEHGHYAREVVVGTVQTVAARLQNYDPLDFATIVIDESHHVVASTYRKIVDHFRQNPDCKILGVTGTPDRADEKALGQIFDATAEPVYGIARAVADGWLVKPLQQFVELEGLDISKVRTTAGELNAGDLAQILEDEKLLRQIESAIVDRVGAMRTLVFAATVAEAELLTDIFNARTPGIAGCVSGKTPDDVRLKTFSEFERGDLQFLVNVGIATEGTDLPHVECVANARMTKSRALYEQICGRALRTLPGIVDGLPTPEARLAAIAGSAKPTALLLDFVGNSGKHKLMTVADILGGDMSPEHRIKVNARIKRKGKPADIAEELQAVKEEEAKRREANLRARERRQRAVVDARYTTRDVDPFGSDAFRQSSFSAPTPKQLAFLKSHGHANPERYTGRQASAIISKIKSDRSANSLSDKQKNILKNFGYDLGSMTADDGKRTVDALAANGWKAIPRYSETHETREGWGEPAF